MADHTSMEDAIPATENRKSSVWLTVTESRMMMMAAAGAGEGDSPVLKAVRSMKMYLEEMRPKLIHPQVQPPQETWLPITESRNGNAYYAAFHTLNAGIGIQALLLPVAFAELGWIWGILALCLAFIWQFYTLWLLIQLHEPIPGGIRYSRYLHLSMAAFGEKRGKLMALFPIMYLSGGTCVTLIMIGGGTLEIFFKHLSTVEWYIVFTFTAILLAQLPNLNSIAGVSLIGAISGVTLCSMIWVVSVLKGRPAGVFYDDLPSEYDLGSRVRKVVGGLGIIAFGFRGHNLVLEIQGTMPSCSSNPSRVPMWKGVKFAYLIIVICLFPLAIGGYWCYGQLIPSEGGMMGALEKYHKHDTSSRVILGLVSLVVVINCVMSFQIYAMAVFDNLEMRYTSRKREACPWWVRSGLRVLFGGIALFISVAVPFLPSLAGLIGGVALPVTVAYPCLMWVMIKKPNRYSGMWWVNWVLGGVGIVLSVLVILGAIWTIVVDGIEVHFFKPPPPPPPPHS